MNERERRKPFNITLNDKEKKLLHVLSKQSGIPMSRVLSMLIREEFARRFPDKKDILLDAEDLDLLSSVY